LRDYPDAATRDLARHALREIDQALEDSGSGDATRIRVAAIRRDFHLTSEFTAPVPSCTEFREALRGLIYQQHLADQRLDVEDEPTAPQPTHIDRETTTTIGAHAAPLASSEPPLSSADRTAASSSVV
jgi:hypothetical protein